MPKYIFASLRGSDFIACGDSPILALNSLYERNKDNGNLWKLGDKLRNKYAVENQGFSYLGNEFNTHICAYKELKE